MATNSLQVIDATSFPYVVETNTDILLRDGGLLRANVYRPKNTVPQGDVKVPVLVTYGPYGKNVPYKSYFPKSYNELNPKQRSEHSAWEVPDPGYWTSVGYAVARVDERGCGQSPGKLDTMSRGTSEAFFDVVEWCADQTWSSGKAGILGISYYAGTQWRVAARQPRGLAAIIPWEGMSDYYRDRVRHGGILSDKFIAFWWNHGVVTNQYGRGGKEEKGWGVDTIEGLLTPEQLLENRQDQRIDTAKFKYRDEEYYSSKEFDLADIKVSLLSFANWGGILLHLRENVLGWMGAGSKHKFLRFIVGRHDLPFYYDEAVEFQTSFLDAFLKGEDKTGWTKEGAVPKVDIVLRKGDGRVDNPEQEKIFPHRAEIDWPLPDIVYTRYYLNVDGTLSENGDEKLSAIEYDALKGEPLTYTTKPAESEIEITEHPVLHVSVSSKAKDGKAPPRDIDVLVTLRHFNSEGKELFYTGTMGDNLPVVKGWLRLSLRKIDKNHPNHRPYLPHRNYYQSDLQEVKAGEVYETDVEIWPTNVVLEKGKTLQVEIAGHDTQGTGHFQHSHPEDRAEEIFDGINSLHLCSAVTYLVLPIIPTRK